MRRTIKVLSCDDFEIRNTVSDRDIKRLSSKRLSRCAKDIEAVSYLNDFESCYDVILPITYEGSAFATIKFHAVKDDGAIVFDNRIRIMSYEVNVYVDKPTIILSAEYIPHTKKPLGIFARVILPKEYAETYHKGRDTAIKLIGPNGDDPSSKFRKELQL